MMNIRVLDTCDTAWPEALSALDHDVYHTPEYLQLEAERTGALPRALLIADGPRLFFLPFLLRDCCDVAPDTVGRPVTDVVSPYGYPGFLPNAPAQHDGTFITASLRICKEWLREEGACSAFLRLHPIYNEAFDGIDDDDFSMTTSETVSVDLTLTEEQLWNHTRKGHRSTINKCIRLGFKPRVVPFADYSAVFQEIYQETMSRVSANDTYLFNERYFASLEGLGDKLHLGIVESKGEIAAACLFFECCHLVQAHLAGTRSAFLHLSPFHLVLHHARLWARARGNRVMHLGGGLGGAKDALFTFKSGFSKTRHRFSTLRIVLDELKYESLLRSRAGALSVTPEVLRAADFFPAYRAPAASFEDAQLPPISAEVARS